MDGAHDKPGESLPAGVLCVRCAYDLGGLSPDGVCPECGLDARASWPVWDLRACHRVYVEHLAEEFRMLHWVALASWVVLMATLVACLGALLAPRVGGLSGVAVVSWLASVCVLVVLPLLVWYARRSLRAHANTGRSPGAANRRRLRLALLVGQVGLVLVLLSMGLGLVMVGVPQSVLLASTCIASIGLACASFEAWGYAGLTRQRAGVASGRRGLLIAWAIALVAGAVSMAATILLDIEPALRIAAIVGPQLAPATMITLRCGRVLSVVESIATPSP